MDPCPSDRKTRSGPDPAVGSSDAPCAVEMARQRADSGVRRHRPRRLLEQPVAADLVADDHHHLGRDSHDPIPFEKTTSSAPQTSGTLVPQTSTGTEFFSPSKNISCEIDANFGPSAITSTLCLTIAPPKSVTLGPDGSAHRMHRGSHASPTPARTRRRSPTGMSITLGALHVLVVDRGHQVHAGRRRRLPHFEGRDHLTGKRQGGRRLGAEPGARGPRDQERCGSLGGERRAESPLLMSSSGAGPVPDGSRGRRGRVGPG